MSGWMGYFVGGRKDTKQTARDAIVGLRQQLQVLEKKEDHLQKRIDDEVKKARANAVSNKSVATQALRRKKALEQELDRLSGQRLQIEMHVNTLESANLNAETMAAMKKGADALKTIHKGMTIDQVERTMDDINDQRAVADQISQAISDPTSAGIDIDDEELKNELEELEQEQLNERLAGADHVPVHMPPGAVREDASRHRVAEEDDEEAQLRALQAELEA